MSCVPFCLFLIPHTCRFFHGPTRINGDFSPSCFIDDEICPFTVAVGVAPNAADFGTAGANSCSGVAQATRFFTSFLAQHRTARAVPLPKSVTLGLHRQFRNIHEIRPIPIFRCSAADYSIHQELSLWLLSKTSPLISPQNRTYCYPGGPSIMH